MSHLLLQRLCPVWRNSGVQMKTGHVNVRRRNVAGVVIAVTGWVIRYRSVRGVVTAGV